MADRSLRGMRLGAQSLQSEEGVVYSPRSRYTYLCPACGKETEVVFSAEAEAPDTWECKHCGQEAHRLVGDTPVSLIDGEMTSWYGSRAIAGLEYLDEYTAGCSL